MAYDIPVPSNDETYSLVSDLALMASTISGHLDGLSERINNSAVAGSGAAFSSIAVAGTGQFNQVVINGPYSNSSLNNDTNGFGLHTGGASFVSKGTKWASSGQITVPDNGTTTDVVNFNDLATALAPLLTRLTALEATAGTIGTNYVTLAAFNSSQDAQNTQINDRATITQLAGKVNNYGGDINKAFSANTATTATTTTGRVPDTTKVMGRMVTVGRANVGSVPANTSKSLRITYPARPAGTNPVIFAQATADDGAVSVICSVDDIGLSAANIRYKNINTSGAEATLLNWLVI